MNTGTDHSADYKALSILTLALMSGVVLFCIISIALNYFGDHVERVRDDSQTVFTIVFLVSLVVLIATRFVYSRRIKVLKETNETSREKLDIFRSITITHMALCEFTALLNIICFMVLGNYLFFIPVAMALAEMLMKFPTREKIDSAIHSGTF